MRPLEVPLPDVLDEFRSQRSPVLASTPGALNPMAISAALGVAGLPIRSVSTFSVPPLLALPEPAELTPADELPFVKTLSERLMPILPTPLVRIEEEVATSPIADYMVLLTDRPPVNVQEISDEAISSALALDTSLPERVETSTYLPNLEGVEVSRVAEGISLRVQDRLLFPSATAELTEGGSSLVGSLLETIQRYDGEVWVEGHSDSQTINTPEFSSNWALSSARAIAIVEALEEAGVASERLRAVGLAATQPLEDNSTAEGRARNRRVEVVIHVE
ncbi:OmpA family protein [Halomonas sp. KX33721]|uniref:OmpA family protein n=1 Tax=Halomonas sp. KX33721 TaxID=1819251 RepID=UPI000B0E44FE|nr:OmpA family protein [Halomonas sp. KX33721]